MCKQKNGLESKFQTLSTRSLAFITSSQSHHIPYCPFYSFACSRASSRYYYEWIIGMKVSKIFCIDHIWWKHWSVKFEDPTIWLLQLKWRASIIQLGHVLWMWMASILCLSIYTSSLVDQKVCSTNLEAKSSFTLGFKDTSVESPNSPC